MLLPSLAIAFDSKVALMRDHNNEDNGVGHLRLSNLFLKKLHLHKGKRQTQPLILTIFISSIAFALP